jgi:hypothetical protein
VVQHQYLAQEWSILQHQFDSYEKASLAIKLVSLLLVAFALLLAKLSFAFLCLVLILWLQDGIWKTFQARIEQRLLVVEQMFNDSMADKQPAQIAFQLNRQFLANRSSTLKLVAEYLQQACRPTVAFPHALLLLICIMALR